MEIILRRFLNPVTDPPLRGNKPERELRQYVLAVLQIHLNGIQNLKYSSLEHAATL